MRGLFGLRTVAHPSCLRPIPPYVPISPLPKNVYHGSTLSVLIKERNIVERAEETTSVPNSPIFYITRNCLFFGPFHTHGPLLRRIMYSKFLALRLLRQIYIYITFIISCIFLDNTFRWCWVIIII